ncbi:hypothetical protein [Wocania ichthyoenteri]|uniref:hypothetical protein n=1 Tax=Wocania ichthyoenteri TaxID=1230531 RepID=UPI00053DCB91|nr:hypothetical protein [Wocania ichthyoenteri]
MKKLLFKTILYSILILLVLEVIIRTFYLTKDYPSRYIDEFNVEKWVPNQTGLSVTGIRRQNFSEYKINSSGYNSYREFAPSDYKTEIALVGDSFIEGFHQDYYNSIGKKIENKIKNIEVYEFGYAGYDLADQLHLIHAYKNMFNKIDHVVLGLKFKNDLTRGEYKIIQDRIHLETPLYKSIRKVKLIVYAQNSGVFDPILNLIGRISSIFKGKQSNKLAKEKTKEEIEKTHLAYMENFKSLVKKYGYDKKRFVLLLDSTITPQIFLKYLNENNYEYIDFYDTLNESKLPTTLIYDKHWNNHGRDLIASVIVNYYRND